MRRFVSVVFMLFVSVFMAVVSWFVVLKPAYENNIDFLESSNPVKYVTIPLGGTKYVMLVIDGVNTELIQSNQLSVWNYNDLSITRTQSEMAGKLYKDGVYYMSNKQVYKKFEDYYITATSPEGYVKVVADSMANAVVMDKICPTLEEDIRILELPKVTLPALCRETNGWKLPYNTEELVMNQSSDDMSYYSDGWYLNYNFRYMKFEDAIEDAATRVCALSGESLEWWYKDDNVFIAKAGSEYVCINQKDYTSGYFISSSDLSYIVLNLGK